MREAKDATEAAASRPEIRDLGFAPANDLVLVVEGDPEMNGFICESLTPEHRVAVARDGQEGLASALELRPDVILTALRLRGLDGEGLVRAVRCHRELERTPIVLLTTRADDELRARLLRDGAQDCLTEPFAVDELRARIDSMLSGRRALEAEARLASLVAQAPDGIFVADLSGRYTEVNEAGCRMLGYARQEIIGKTILDLIPPQDAERLSDSKQYMLDGGVHVAEWTLRRKDGTHLPVEVSARILPDGRWQGFVRDISERTRARDSLRQAQERFELALKGADLAAWDWNMQSGEVIFNGRWAEMRGFEPEEIGSHVDSWISGVHPDDWPRVRKELDDYVRGRVSEYESEHRVRTKSGEWIWVLDRGKIFVRDAQGQPLRMVGTELDINGRKRAEEALRLAEAKSSGILSISADAIISIDSDQRMTMFNEGAEKLFGYSKAEAIGAPLEMLIPERFRAIHRQHVESFMASPGVSRRMDARRTAVFGLRKNGQEFPADAVISKLEVGGTQILNVALRDVTAQKRIERDQRFLAEVGPLLSSTLDYEETLSRVSQLAVRELADFCVVDVVEEGGEVRRLKVASRDPTKAAACSALMRVPLDRTRPHLVGAALESKRPVLMARLSPEEVESLSQSEEHLSALRGIEPRSIISVPLLAHDELLGAIALVSSTESRVYGPEDVDLAVELAHRAAIAIEKARLYLAARRAIQVRDEVLGIVAHDLRNPLGAILLQAQRLRRFGVEPQRPAEAIDRAAARMNRLIQDLLDVTQMEAGHFSIEGGRLQTAVVMGDAFHDHAALASSASLELRLDAAGDLPDVWADRDRLLQVFENLIGNALKFGKPGGQVTLGAAPREGEVLFWVTDNGPGISPEDVPRMFDRFWQAKRGGRHGAGLGLPIVRGIVESHGGRVWVECTGGRGSTFFFTIPTAARANQSRPDDA